jgi:peptidyl-prolyl cis-trans isomerase A (cyclophilin A)
MTGLRSVIRLAICSAPLALLAGNALPPSRGPGIVPVRVETSLGTIDVDIDSAHARITATNFLRYVDAGAYSNGRFHRTVTPENQPRDTVRIEVVQAGPNPQREGARYPAIALETTRVTGLRHEDGTISMARGGPNTATADFFIVIGAQPSLDEGGHRNLDGQGFAAFGHVVRGMDIVRRIQQSPADGQSLTPPVTIVRLTRR